MKKFKFTLQTVHNVREIRQEKESIILSELRAEAELAASRVAEIKSQRAEAVDNYTLRLNSGEPLNTMEMELVSNHFSSLNCLQKDAERILEEKNQACRKQMELLSDAMKEVKITDRLRETQKLRHDLEYSRQEQNNIDEIVSANYARQIIQPK